jgi:hypothetical protein
MSYTTNKVNGHVASGEHLTSSIDYFTVSTTVDLANTAPIANNVQTALDKLIEIVAQRGQPVIQGAVSGTGPYILKFATEHKGSWNVTGTQAVDNSAVDLKAAILAAGVDFGFDANTSVTVSASL